MQAGMKKMGSDLTRMGRLMTLKITAPLVGIATASVKAFANFDDAMTKSLAIMGDVSGSMRSEMEQLALSISEKSVTSATELAESYFFLASAGLSAEQSMASLATVEKFAVAGAFDMALATDLLTDAQSALGMASDDTATHLKNMTHISNVLVGANTLANASVQQFSEALTADAASSMKTLNISLEEGVAVLAAYADRGKKAAEGGNLMGRMLRLLLKNARENGKEFERLGVSIKDSSGNLLPMGTLIGNVSKAFEGLTPIQKEARLNQMGFTALAQKSILPLIGAGDQITKYTKQLKEMGDITEEVANKQLKSFSSQIKIFKNQIVNVGREIGSILAPSILAMNERIKGAIEWWKELTGENKKFIVKLLAIAAAAGPVLIALGFVATAVASLLSPLKLVTIAIGLMVVKGTVGFEGLGDAIKNLTIDDLQAWVKRVKNEILFLKDVFFGFANYLQTNWQDALAGVWDAAIELMIAAGKSMAEVAFGVGKSIWKALKSALNPSVIDNEKIMEEYKNLIDKMKDAGPVKQNLTMEISVGRKVIPLTDPRREAEQQGFKKWKVDPDLWNKAEVMAQATAAAEGSGDIWETMTENVKGIWQEALADIKTKAPELGNFLEEALNKRAVRAAADEWERLQKVVGEFNRGDIAGLDDFIAKVKEGKAAVEVLGEAVTQAVEKVPTVFDKVKGKMEEVRDAGADLFENWVVANRDAMENMKNVASAALDGVSDALTDLVMKGKADFNALASSIVADIMRVIIRAQVANAMGIAFGIGKAAVAPEIGKMQIAGSAGQTAITPKFHSGGLVTRQGPLRSDEIMSKLQIGEVVLNRDEVKQIRGRGDAGGVGGGGSNNTYHINAVDASSFFQLLNRDPGMVASVVEKAQMSGNHPSRRRRDDR